MSTKSNPFVPGAAKMAPQVEGGLHPGVCVALYDVGTHTDPIHNKEKRKYVFVFELPAAPPIEIDGQKLPRTLSMNVTASMHPKGILRPMLENWRGKKFTDEQAGEYDITKVLGQRALVNVVHEESNGKTYANIKAVLPAPKDAAFSASTQPVSWSVTSLESPGELAQLDIPDWVKKKASDSKEFKALGLVAGDDDRPANPEDF